MDINAGHRERLKTKFLNNKAESFYDYEMLELLLFHAIPRKDVRPLAKILLKEFGNMSNVINANPLKLSQIPGVGPSVMGLFKLIKEIVFMVNKEQIVDQPFLDSAPKMMEYLRTKIGYQTTEYFVALYLNHRKKLIAEEINEYGTISGISMYPREILKSAIFHDASSVIVAHNHPSGYTRPSKTDVEMTLSLQNTLKTAGINLVDHIVVSKFSNFSFKINNMI